MKKADYDCVAHYWYNNTDEKLAASFEAGKSYSLCWEFEIWHGYAFDAAPNFTVNDNGEGCIIDMNRSTYTDTKISLWLEPVSAEEDKLITNAEIKGADITPVVGDKAGDHMTFELPADAPYTAEVIGWYNDGTHSYLQADDVFAEGKQYSVGWRLSAKQGYKFSEEPYMTINGQTEIVDKKNSLMFDSDNKVFDLWILPVTALSSDTIFVDMIEIDAVDTTPQVGEKAMEHVGYTIPEGANYSIGTVIWVDADNMNPLTEDDVFAAGVHYMLALEVCANEGCAFVPDAVVKVNGGTDGIYDKYTGYYSHNEYTVVTTPVLAQEAVNTDIKVGDLNDDDTINTADAVVVLKVAAGMITADDTMNKAGDCNHDGTVNTADAVLILKYAAGMITEF